MAAQTDSSFNSRGVALALLLPAFAVYVIAFILPVFKLGEMSFLLSAQGGALQNEYTFGNYLNFLIDTYYLELIFNSVLMSLVVTVFTLICAYPVAMLIHVTSAKWRNFLIIITISPLLVSSIVRTYGWMLLLGDTGVINGLLQKIGLTDQPIRMLNDYSGVIIGLVEILMPYMALALLAGFGRLEDSITDAAASLGANAFKRFIYVTLPLTAPGIALGSLLCFVLSISSFVTPRLLGGGRVFLLATEIYDQAIIELQWPMASALSVILLILFTITLTAYAWIARRGA